MEGLNESRIGAVITEAFAVSVTASTPPALHARHGVRVLVGLDSDVTVAEPGGAQARGRVVMVPPDISHTSACSGPSLELMYDPELLPEAAGYARLRGGVFPLEGRLASHFEEAVDAHRAILSRPDVLDGISRESAARLSKESPRRGPDRRVARLLEALRDPTVDRRDVLERAGISQAHLRALFVRDVGLPIRTYQLWRRLLVGVAAFSRIDATSAAHFAGFADLAHFSRTCRRMLGGSPTELGRAILT